MVFDESGFRVYYVGVDWGLNFLSGIIGRRSRGRAELLLLE